METSTGSSSVALSWSQTIVLDHNLRGWNVKAAGSPDGYCLKSMSILPKPFFVRLVKGVLERIGLPIFGVRFYRWVSVDHLKTDPTGSEPLLTFSFPYLTIYKMSGSMSRLLNKVVIVT